MLSNSTKRLILFVIFVNFISKINSESVQQNWSNAGDDERGNKARLTSANPLNDIKVVNNSLGERRKSGSFDPSRPDKYLKRLVNYVTKSMSRQSRKGKTPFDMSSSIAALSGGVYEVADVLAKLSETARPIQLRLRQTIFEFLISLNISNQCFGSLMQLSKALGQTQTQLWPLKLFDSIGRIPSGLAEGVITSFGEYDQCLDVESDIVDSYLEEYKIRGKYCLVRPYLPFSALKDLSKLQQVDWLSDQLTNLVKDKLKTEINHLKVLLSYNLVADKLYLFHLGVCMPSQCTRDDLHNALNQVFYPLARVAIEVSPCDTDGSGQEWNKWQVSKLQWVVLLSSILMVIFVSVSSVIHIFNLSLTSDIGAKRRITSKTLLSFSLIEANKRLFSPLGNRLKIADGLMLFYIGWTVAATSYASIITSGLVGYKKIFQSFVIRIATDPQFFWLRTLFQRDSILFMSGVIISYDYFGPNYRPNTIRQYIKFLAEKYCRFLPKIIGPMILLTVLSLLGSGPNWHSAHKIFFTSCQQNWWKNILFINNFEADSTNHCVQMSWFLAVIFQLQALSPLLMVLFRRSARLGYIVGTGLMVASGLVAIAPKLIHNYKLIPYEVSELWSVDEMRYSANRFFIETDQYICVFIFGLIIGHFLRNRQSFDRLVTSNLIRTMIAIGCLSLSVFAVLWAEKFKDVNQPPNETNLILWYGMSKIMWMSGNVCILYYLDGNTKCLINRCLSSRLLCALTRLSLGICLTSLIIIYYNVFTRRQSVQINHSNQIRILYIDFSQMILVSYLLYIFIEHPIINLLDICRNRAAVGKRDNDIKASTSIEMNYVFE